MSLFDKVADADFFGGGTYPEVGDYNVVVKTCSTQESQNGKGTFTLVEYVVAEVLREFAGNEEFKASNTKGQSIGWTNFASKLPFLGNVKAFVAAILDKDIDSVTKEDCDEVFSGDPQEFAGTTLHMEAIPIHTRAGTPFTKVVWSPAS